MTEKSPTNSEHIRTNASKRLLVNLRILSVVYMVLFVFTVYHLVIAGPNVLQILLAIIIGLVAGIISSRMYKITWDENSSKVVGRIDIYGVIVLILFVIFELNRSHIAGLFAGGDDVGAISLVLVTSALLGRVIGTSRKILRVLMKQEII